MKKVYFNEYVYVLRRYPGEMVISDEDYEKIVDKDGNIDNDYLQELVQKSNYEPEWGCSEDIYDDYYSDSFEFEEMEEE